MLYVLGHFYLFIIIMNIHYHVYCVLLHFIYLQEVVDLFFISHVLVFISSIQCCLVSLFQSTRVALSRSRTSVWRSVRAQD